MARHGEDEHRRRPEAPTIEVRRTSKPTALALMVVGALVAAACAGDEPESPGQTDAGTPSPTAGTTAPTPTVPTGSPDTSPSPSPADTSTAGSEVPDLRERCQLEAGVAGVERVEFAYPDGWQVEADNCEFFDPQLDQLTRGTEPDTAVSVRVEDVAFERAAEPGAETRDEIRHVGARSGYQAVRIRAESTGQGLYPQGQPVLHHLVDLDAGADEQGGTLIATATPSDGADFELAAQALDRIAQTVGIVPTAVGDGAPTVVSRVEGGGTPFTVTYDGECFRLRPGGPTDAVADEACDIDAPDDGISGAVLTDGETEVVAGLAPPLATLVESDAASAPYGAFTASLEGAAAFAYDVVDSPVDLRALDVEGEQIATATIPG